MAPGTDGGAEKVRPTRIPHKRRSPPAPPSGGAHSFDGVRRRRGPVAAPSRGLLPAGTILHDMDSEPRDLLSVVRRALAARDVEHTVDEAEEDAPASVSFSLRGEHTLYDYLATVDEPLDLVVCCARIATRVPEARRGAVCELLTRINYALRIGNFEMDLRDGELLFRTAVDVEGGELTPQMVDSLVGTGYFTFERYFPAIMRVVYGGASPEESLAAPEGGE